MRPSYGDTRRHLLDTGYRIMAVKGFSDAGFNEILQTAGAPKSSFYHYFKSKEQFGQALLEGYFRAYLADTDQRSSAPGLNARERLMSYRQKWLDNVCPPCDEQRCLVVKLNAKVANLSESMRIILRDGSDGTIKRLVGCLGQGRDNGSLAPCDARHVASALYQLWLGASLLSKLYRSPGPLETVMQATRSLLKIWGSARKYPPRERRVFFRPVSNRLV